MGGGITRVALALLLFPSRPVSVPRPTFNAFNGVQWGNPNTTITSAQFGQVTETQSNDPRFIQLAFRYSF